MGVLVLQSNFLKSALVEHVLQLSPVVSDQVCQVVVVLVLSQHNEVFLFEYIEATAANKSVEQLFRILWKLLHELLRNCLNLLISILKFQVLLQVIAFVLHNVLPFFLGVLLQCKPFGKL